MTKRVCIIRQSVYPLDTLVQREAETLLADGFETHVICLPKKAPGDEYKVDEVINGVTVHRIQLKRRKTSKMRYIFEYVLFTFLAGLKLTFLHLRNPFDVIQVNTMPDFLVFAALIPKLLGSKVVVMMYEPVPELWRTMYNSPAPKLILLAEQWALKFSDAAFTVTEQLKETYIARGADGNKITVILNVPENKYLLQDISNQSSLTKNPGFTLICHGAIEKRYGHDTMLDAIALISEKIPDLRLVILGRGSYVDSFLSKRKALKIEDKVDYLGWVSFEEMVHQLQSADVGIVAQESSPYSNLVHTGKMYEYITLGKPVLATRLRSVSAYFGDDAIQYFESGDAESLAEGILDLYNNPSKRQTLVSNAQIKFNEYEWKEQKKKYLAVYQELMP